MCLFEVSKSAGAYEHVFFFCQASCKAVQKLVSPELTLTWVCLQLEAPPKIKSSKANLQANTVYFPSSHGAVFLELG